MSVHSLTLYDDLEEDVRQIIIAEVNAVTASRLTADQNIWRGPVRPANDRAQNHEGVWVMLSSGRAATPFLGDDGTEMRPSLQVRVRSTLAKGNYVSGVTLARQCFLAVDQWPRSLFDNTGAALPAPLYAPTTSICDLRSRNAHPLYLGMDEDGHHEWSFNIEATVFSDG